MKVERMQVQEALAAGCKLPYAMLRYLSEVRLGRAPERVAQEELQEAIFFGREQEIRVFVGEEGLRAVRLCAEPDDRVLEEVRPIPNVRFGGTLTVGCVLDWDEDGQAYVAATRLLDWKEGHQDG